MKTRRFSAKTVWAVAVAIVLGGVAYAGLRLLKPGNVPPTTARSASDGSKKIAENRAVSETPEDAPRTGETEWREGIEDCFRRWSCEGAESILSRAWACTDEDARLERLRVLANATASPDVISVGDEKVRSVVALEFPAHVILPLAGMLEKAGATEHEIGDYMINAWTAYKSLCESFDPDSGKRGAKQRALLANRAYENGCCLLENMMIAQIFWGMPEGAEARFRARWKAAFRPEPTDADAGAKSR